MLYFFNVCNDSKIVRYSFNNHVIVMGTDKNQMKMKTPKKSFLGEPSPEDYVLMKEETFNLEP